MARPEITGKKLTTRQVDDAELPDHAGRVPLRLLTYRELKLVKGIPFSRSEIRRKEARGDFPRHIVLGEGASPTIAWIEHEIDRYILTKMAARTAPVEAVPPRARTRSPRRLVDWTDRPTVLELPGAGETEEDDFGGGEQDRDPEDSIPFDDRRSL
jgi:predicted DNA-binding transcriptional regulator AlpA